MTVVQTGAPRGEHRAPEAARPCPTCGSTGATTLLTIAPPPPADKPYSIVTCTACGLRYTRPLPTDDEMAALYGFEYYGGEKPPFLSWDTIRQPLHRIMVRERRRALMGRPPGRTLDVGCGNGDSLADLRKLGWDVYGTDLSAAAVALVRSKGITVHQGDLASARFPDGFFDVVTLWHVLEHLPEPREELAEIRRILRADGLLVVEVPNIASPTFRLCGARWFPLDVPRHLQHFTPRTLARLLRGAGFTPVRRQNFHPIGAALTWMSFVDRAGLLGQRTGIHYAYFVENFQSAPTLAKLRFLAGGLVLLLLAPVYTVVVTLLTRQGEVVTVSATRDRA